MRTFAKATVVKVFDLRKNGGEWDCEEWAAAGCGCQDSKDPYSPPVWHSVWLLFLYRALDNQSHLFFLSHVASGRCVLLAAAAGAPAGVAPPPPLPPAYR